MNKNIIRTYKIPCCDSTFISGYQLATDGTSFRLYTKMQAKKKNVTLRFNMSKEFKVLLGNHYFKKCNTRSTHRTKTEMPSWKPKASYILVTVLFKKVNEPPQAKTSPFPVFMQDNDQSEGAVRSCLGPPTWIRERPQCFVPQNTQCLKVANSMSKTVS